MKPEDTPSGSRARPVERAADGASSSPTATKGHLRYLLTAYLFDSLSPDGRREVEEHLELCDSCRREHDELRSTLTLLAESLGPGDPPVAFEAARRERVLEAAAGRRRGATGWALRHPRFAVAAVLLVLAVPLGVLSLQYVRLGSQSADRARPVARFSEENLASPAAGNVPADPQAGQPIESFGLDASRQNLYDGDRQVVDHERLQESREMAPTVSTSTSAATRPEEPAPTSEPARPPAATTPAELAMGDTGFATRENVLEEGEAGSGGRLELEGRRRAGGLSRSDGTSSSTGTSRDPFTEAAKAPGPSNVLAGSREGAAEAPENALAMGPGEPSRGRRRRGTSSGGVVTDTRKDLERPEPPGGPGGSTTGTRERDRLLERSIALATPEVEVPAGEAQQQGQKWNLPAASPEPETSRTGASRQGSDTRALGSYLRFRSAPRDVDQPAKEPEPDEVLERTRSEKASSARPTVVRRLAEVQEEIPEGTNLDALTNVDLLGDSIHNAIGIGGGAAGAYGKRITRRGIQEEVPESTAGSASGVDRWGGRDGGRGIDSGLLDTLGARSSAGEPAKGELELESGKPVAPEFARRLATEKLLRAYVVHRANDPQLDLAVFLRNPRNVPAPDVGDEGLGRERFRERYGTNPFVDTRRDHFSTFSMDVDTASFALARKILASGQLPPPEAMRVEEFVNYIEQDYPADPDAVFSIYADGMPSVFGPEGVELLRIGIKARELRENERRNAVLTLAVDVSGSMAGSLEESSRLDLVKAALGVLVEELRPTDQVGLVSFSNQATLVLPHTPARESERIRGAIRSLAPGGGTNLEAGFDMAYRLAYESLSPGSLHRVILVSDGVANVGARGPEEILQKVKLFARRGIYLSAIGVGKSDRYNDEMLKRLTSEGNGNLRYLDSAQEARRVFRENLPATLEVLAEDAKIQVDFHPDAISHYRLLGYERRDIRDEDFRNDAVDAAEVGPGSSVTALYEIVRRPDWTGPLGTVSVRYRDTTTRRVDEETVPLPQGIIAPTVERASGSLGLLACAAELAELLRGSYYARDGSFGQLLWQLHRLDAQTRQRQEWQDMAEMARQAQRLTITAWTTALSRATEK